MLIILNVNASLLRIISNSTFKTPLQVESQLQKDGKSLLGPPTVPFFPCNLNKRPHIFLFALGHVRYVAIPGEQWKEIEWDGGWDRRGQSWATTQQGADICLNALSDTNTPHWNPSSGILSHSELTPKFSLWLYPINTPLPTSLISSPTSHLFPQLQPGYLNCISSNMTSILPPQGLCTCQCPSLELRCPQISGALTSSIPQVSHQMMLLQRGVSWSPYIN